MTDEINLTPDGEGEGSPPPEQKKGPTKGEAVPWKDYKALQDRFNGLQGFVAKQNDQISELTAFKAEQVGVYEAELVTLRGAKSSLESKLQQTEAARAQAEASAQAAVRQQEVSKKIATEFPDLMGVFHKGLLDTGSREGEDLVGYLKGWQEELQGRKKEGETGAFKGGTPPPPSPSTPGADNPLDLVQLDKAWTDAMRVHGVDSTQAKEKESAYLNALFQQQKK